MAVDEPDIPYNEAMQKKQEESADSIKTMNNALVLTKNVAKLVAQYHNELLAGGLTKEDAVTLSHEYARYIMERPPGDPNVTPEG